MTQSVAVLGLGTMGAGMARNLLKAGTDVTVWNRSPARAEPLKEAGATVAATPADAARNADVLLTMLADDQASREVWLGEAGALAAARPGALLIECGTVTPAWVAALEGAARQRDLSLLDAPVTGSKPQAEAGVLTFLVGGEEGALEKARPVLQSMGQAIVHVGPSGSGARLKLINNFLCGVQVASLAEALAWIERSGLNREQALEFLKRAAPGSPLLGGLSARMVEGTYQVNFLLPLMEKDLRYAHRDAEGFGVELRTGAVASSRFADAAADGWAEKDMSAVIEPLRRNRP